MSIEHINSTCQCEGKYCPDCADIKCIGMFYINPKRNNTDSRYCNKHRKVRHAQQQRIRLQKRRFEDPDIYKRRHHARIERIKSDPDLHKQFKEDRQKYDEERRKNPEIKIKEYKNHHKHYMKIKSDPERYQAYLERQRKHQAEYIKRKIEKDPEYIKNLRQQERERYQKKVREKKEK